MSHIYADRVKETTTTTGTGTLTLAGAAVGFQSFDDALADGDTCYYTITDGTDWEVGLGTFTASGTLLARTNVIDSSNAAAAVSFGAGTKEVFITHPAIISQYTVLQTVGATDNHVARYDGASGLILQDSSVVIDDSGHMSGIGNIALSGTVDGRDVSTDGTRLDAITDAAYKNSNTTKAQVGLSNVSNVDQIPLSYLDTDGTLAGNSDVKVPSQKAVKTYADQLIASADAMVFKGVIDCSANPNYPAADKGWTYRISVAGKIGGASGINVEIGDIIICLADSTASGNQATVGTSWSIAQTNVDGAVIGPASVTDDLPAIFDGTTGKLIKSKTYAAFKTLLALVKGDVGLGNVDNTSNATERAAAATLTNKTIDGDDNTLQDIPESALKNGGTLRTVWNYTANDTWSKPAGLRYIIVEVVGGGGGGGGIAATSASLACGGGGGGGGFSRKKIAAASLGTTETVTVGAAGAGNSAADGGTGGTSSLGSLLQATGGAGGVALGVGTTEQATPGGTGGVGSSGDLNIDGADGFHGIKFSTARCLGGNGGNSHYGGGGRVNGGSSTSQKVIGDAGGNYGGGGAGSVSAGTQTAGAGGAGAAGVVIVYEYF